MTDNTWLDYVEKTKSKPPRPLLVKALQFLERRDIALDLGAGALNDSIYLLSEKFVHVTAIDKEPVAAKIAKDLPLERFTYKISSLEDTVFPADEVDLVNAQYALPFIKPERFDEVWERISNSLKIGGVFTGQLFGQKDEWAGNRNMTFHTKAAAHQILARFDLLDFEEEEADKPTAMGNMKHWHVFHFIARK